MTNDVASERGRPKGALGTSGGDWLAFYIFYTAVSRPIIVECITPLIAELREKELIEGYFFMNYWLRGPHVRLRIKPVSHEARALVEPLVAERLREYVRQRPALFQIKGDQFAKMYDDLFDLEFAAEDRAPHVDENGVMVQQPNNTVTLEEYEPEYGKYGGAAGMEIAEWHFEQSSDLIARIDATINVHSRPILLGVGSQLMIIMASVFLSDDSRVASYMHHYHLLWKQSLGNSVMFAGSNYDAMLKQIDFGKLRRQYRQIADAARGTGSALPTPFGDWMSHCQILKERITAAAPTGTLIFDAWGSDASEVIIDPVAALERLLSAYMHMTSNRLQITLGDEAYLSLLISNTVGSPGE